MGHCYCVVGTDGAHIVYDNCRGVVVCNVTDFLSVCTIPRSHQRHPGGVVQDRWEPEVWVARLPVLQEGRHQDQTSGLFLGRVLAIPPALGFICPDLRSDGVQVGDVDKCCVPLLFFCYREVQAQQVDETKRQQPRRESQTATSSDEGRCHCGCAAGLGCVMSSGSPPHWKARTSVLFSQEVQVETFTSHTIQSQLAAPHRLGVQRVCRRRAKVPYTPPPAEKDDALCCCSLLAASIPRSGLAQRSSARDLGVYKVPLTPRGTWRDLNMS